MTFKNAIALVEFNSIAHGIAFADEMVKGGNVKLLDNYPTCPGKHIIIVSGDTDAVKQSVKNGFTVGKDFVLEYSIIPNIHEDVLKSTMGISDISLKDIDAIGIIESYSIIKCVEAADIALKESQVRLVDMRLGKALGGKAFFIITGEVGAVKSSIMAAVEFLKENTNLVQFKVIPAPAEELKKSLL
ncbi:BMC domain-containing protein [bacterium]|nr:BMC domain-containing protein [bacterium]